MTLPTEREHILNELRLLANHIANLVKNGEDAPAYMWAQAREYQKWLKEHPTEPEPRYTEIDTDDPALSPETRAEIVAVGTPIVTGLDEDRAALKKLRDEFDAAWEARIVAQSDVADIENRNSRIDALDQRMRELKNEMAVWEACVSIAGLEPADDNEGGTS